MGVRGRGWGGVANGLCYNMLCAVLCFSFKGHLFLCTWQTWGLDTFPNPPCSPSISLSMPLSLGISPPVALVQWSPHEAAFLVFPNDRDCCRAFCVYADPREASAARAHVYCHAGVVVLSAPLLRLLQRDRLLSVVLPFFTLRRRILFFTSLWRRTLFFTAVSGCSSNPSFPLTATGQTKEGRKEE